MAAAAWTFSIGCCCSRRLLPSSAVNLTTTSILRRRTLSFIPLPDHHRLPRSFSSSPVKCSPATQTVREPETSNRRRPNVVDILEERGLLESITSDNLRSVCSDPTRPPLKVYCGFDPTAESLHLGNLLGIIVLSWFIRCGHKAVALVGGATARVGDPSGKSIERPELDLVTLEKNTAGIESTLKRILGSNSDSLEILNNYDWWKDVKLLDFLKNVGRFARVGSMISKESVKKRLESDQGMSYTEFTYQLLQGYDFLHLFDKMCVSVQIGGSDQWGNITAGTDLIRKILQSESGNAAFGLTFPLLLKSDGTKFGKSEDGALWLSPTMLSPYKFYQYFFSVPDTDAVRFLKTLTFLTMEEITKIQTQMQEPGYVPNTVQRRLAEEVTRFVHGQEGLEEALKATEALKPGADTKLDWQTIEGIAGDVPSCSLRYDEVLNLSVVDLSVSTGLVETKSAARRLLKQGGFYLNNSRVESESKKVEDEDIVDGKILLLSAGKKNKMVLHVIDGVPQLIFVRSSYTIETVEAERISVDHVAHLKPSDGGSAATQLAANLTGLHSAIKMLNSRIRVLHHYLIAMQKGDIPLENSLLRQVSSLLRRLPAIESEKFEDDFLTEYNDTLLITYLAMFTNCSSTMNDLVDKLNVAYDKHTRRGGRTASPLTLDSISMPCRERKKLCSLEIGWIIKQKKEHPSLHFVCRSYYCYLR